LMLPASCRAARAVPPTPGGCGAVGDVQLRRDELMAKRDETIARRRLVQNRAPVSVGVENRPQSQGRHRPLVQVVPIVAITQTVRLPVPLRVRAVLTAERPRILVGR